MYGTIYREIFVTRMESFDVASGWSSEQLFLLFDHLEQQEDSTGVEIKFDVALLSDWEPYDTPDEWLEMNSEQADPTNFSDYDNPEWGDVRNHGRQVLAHFSTSEGVVSLH
jgi:hypothetical protein